MLTSEASTFQTIAMDTVVSIQVLAGESEVRPASQRALEWFTTVERACSRFDQVLIGALVALASVTANLLGAGETYLLVGLLAGNGALAARRWLAQRPRG
jgi:hypothetical protein